MKKKEQKSKKEPKSKDSDRKEPYKDTSGSYSLTWLTRVPYLIIEILYTRN